MTDRVIDTVFRGRTADRRLHHGLLDQRPSILVTFGRVRTSGVNTALLSLLKNIDPIRYDVTVLVLAPTNALERELQEMIPTSVRQLVRIGTFPATAHRLDGNDRYLSVGLNPDGSFPDDEANVLRAAWQHAFGLSRFDYAIDFSGYSPFWPSVLLQGDVDKRAIWMHNDMAAEAGRGAHGDQFKHRGLPAVFTLYHRFDSLVSVSEALSQINATQLSDLAPAEKFTCAHNTVDVERTRSLGSGCDVLGGSAASDIRVDNVPLSTAAAQFVRAFPLEFVTDEVRRQAELMRLMPDREHTTTFVTAGRLSPEKNHDRMIRAFAEVHRQHPQTRLLILGDGPLKGDIELLVQRLGLGDVVRLAGHQSNPFMLLGEADCFVLSSDYEGQPMVILEALTLGLPVVTVEFGSAASALPNNGGMIVPQSVDGLADGMRSFLTGEVNVRKFDVNEYNDASIDEFLTAIGCAQQEPAQLVQ